MTEIAIERKLLERFLLRAAKIYNENLNHLGNYFSCNVCNRFETCRYKLTLPAFLFYYWYILGDITTKC